MGTDVNWYIVPKLSTLKQYFVPDYAGTEDSGPYLVFFCQDSRVVFDHSTMAEIMQYYTQIIQENAGASPQHWLYDEKIGWLRPREQTVCAS